MNWHTDDSKSNIDSFLSYPDVGQADVHNVMFCTTEYLIMRSIIQRARGGMLIARSKKINDSLILLVSIWVII